MIVLEITDESGVSHYEILGLTREGLEAVVNEAGRKKAVGNAAKTKGTPYKPKEGKDKQADSMLFLIGKARATLIDKEQREKYNKELDSGRGAILEILRIQSVAPPVFTDRAVRLRIIEEMMRSAGLSRRAWEVSTEKDVK